MGVWVRTVKKGGNRPMISGTFRKKKNLLSNERKESNFELD